MPHLGSAAHVRKWTDPVPLSAPALLVKVYTSRHSQGHRTCEEVGAERDLLSSRWMLSSASARRALLTFLMRLDPRVGPRSAAGSGTPITTDSFASQLLPLPLLPLPLLPLLLPLPLLPLPLLPLPLPLLIRFPAGNTPCGGIFRTP